MTSLKSFINMPKIDNHQTQLKTIFNYLSKRVATASMVSAETGVPQKNICRYKRDLEQAGRLVEIRKGICKVTRFKAWYITCDESKFPRRTQLTIFE